MHLLSALSDKRLLSLMLFFMLTACTDAQKPANLLSEEEMTRVMMEVYTYEEKINRLNLRRDSAEKIFLLAEPIIFQKIGVPDSVFKRSYDYYIEHPKQLESIYTALVDSLNLREQKLSASKPAEKVQ
jgi:Domain of unknown function (DUF4296)